MNHRALHLWLMVCGLVFASLSYAGDDPWAETRRSKIPSSINKLRIDQVEFIGGLDSACNDSVRQEIERQFIASEPSPVEQAGRLGAATGLAAAGEKATTNTFLIFVSLFNQHEEIATAAHRFVDSPVHALSCGGAHLRRGLREPIERGVQFGDAHLLTEGGYDFLAFMVETNYTAFSMRGLVRGADLLKQHPGLSQRLGLSLERQGFGSFGEVAARRGLAVQWATPVWRGQANHLQAPMLAGLWTAEGRREFGDRMRGRLYMEPGTPFIEIEPWVRIPLAFGLSTIVLMGWSHMQVAQWFRAEDYRLQSHLNDALKDKTVIPQGYEPLEALLEAGPVKAHDEIEHQETTLSFGQSIILPGADGVQYKGFVSGIFEFAGQHYLSIRRQFASDSREIDNERDFALIALRDDSFKVVHEEVVFAEGLQLSWYPDVIDSLAAEIDGIQSIDKDSASNLAVGDNFDYSFETSAGQYELYGNGGPVNLRATFRNFYVENIFEIDGRRWFMLREGAINRNNVTVEWKRSDETADSYRPYVAPEVYLDNGKVKKKSHGERYLPLWIPIFIVVRDDEL